jgi:hypothetical protein
MAAPSEGHRKIKVESEKSSAQSAILLAAAVLVIAVLAVLFGLQTLLWLNTRQWTSLNPWLADTPQPLQPVSATQGDLPPLPGDKAAKSKPAKPAQLKAQLKAYDYEFTSPWSGNVKTSPGISYVQFQFDSGQVIVFFDPEAQIDVVRQMKSSETPLYQPFQNIFGEQSPESNYALYQTVYSASPAQISPFMNRQIAFRSNILLLWKLSFGFDAQPGIHSIDLGMNRGFEFGDAATGRPVALRLFDDRDKQFRFIFTVASGSSGQFTQSDINTVAQSLRLIPILER